MNPIKGAIITVTFLFMSAIIIAQEKYSTIKIYPPADKQQRASLLGLLEIDHFTMQDSAIIAEISQEDIKLLRQTAYRYEILVNDVAANLYELNSRYFNASPQQKIAMEQSGNTVDNIITAPPAFQVFSGSPNLGGFYTFAQMNTAMNNLVAAYPSIAQKTSLGLSVQGRDIWCIKISDNVNTDELNEPEILYIGLQHAREAIGGTSMIFFMEYLCENYAADTKIQNLVNNREIYIIPCMNPDGWEYNRVNDPDGGGGWRKNRANNGDGTFGVDLNRNWSVDWANCGGAGTSCGSGSTSSDVYWGTAPFSEPESNEVRNFVKARNFVACIDQHSFGPYYSLPFGRPGLHTGADTLTLMEQQFYSKIPALMGKYNGMRAGNSLQSVGYEVAGGVKDWMLKGEIGMGTKARVLGLTGEGGAGGGTGGSFGSFWPPASQIVNLCKGMTYQNLQLAFAAGSYIDISDQSDISVSASVGSFNFNLKRIGVDDEPVTVTLIPIENITTVGAPVTVNSMAGYFDLYNGSISYSLRSGINNGHRIRYAWRVETGGYTYYDTLVKFFNPIQLFYDDMEGPDVNTNWSVSANWDYTGAAAFAGVNSLTESPAGLYAADRDDTIRYRNTFNLSDATAAYLTFWVEHRAENFRDKVQVQVSANGISWVSIAGKTTAEEPGTLDGSTLNGEPALTGIREDWAPEVFDLGAYLGQPALRLRFVFSSDANTTGYDFQTDDGFYFDNVKVIKSVTNLVILPVEFISFTGTLKADNTIELNWEAVTDEQHDYFIVEKSINGFSFTETGRVYSRPFSFIDKNPLNGNNYYRIKAVDKDGSTMNSRIINIPFSPQVFTLKILPNPVQNYALVSILHQQTGSLKILITDVNGRQMYQRMIAAGESGAQVSINTSGWSAQLYIVKVLNERNEVMKVQKFIKL